MLQDVAVFKDDIGIGGILSMPSGVPLMDRIDGKRDDAVRFKGPLALATQAFVRPHSDNVVSNVSVWCGLTPERQHEQEDLKASPSSGQF
jgi:hypothetical protein